MVDLVLSSAFKISNIVLSNGDLTATASGSVDGTSWAYCPVSLPDLDAGNLYYFEVQLGSSITDLMVGIGNMRVQGTGGYPGQSSQSIAWMPATGVYYQNGGSTSTGTGNAVASDVCCVAFTKTKIWFRLNNGAWLGNNTNHNPATNTGGITHNIVNYLQINYRCKQNATAMTFRLKSADWTQSAVSGAIAIPGLPNFANTGKFSTADYQTPTVFSDSNYVVGADASNSDRNFFTEAAMFDNTKKVYAEFELLIGGTNWSIGIENTYQGLSTRPRIRFDNNDLRKIYTDTTSFTTGWSAFTANNTLVQVAVTSGKVWYKFNNTGNWNNTVGDDPATNTGGIAHTLPAPWFPVAFKYESGISIRNRSRADKWSGTPPSGFVDIYGNVAANYLARRPRGIILP